MGVSETNDASFYEYVSRVIDDQRQEVDRRRRQRGAFEPIQLIAPLKANGLADTDKFVPIVCRDLSPSGFSFVSDDPPKVDKLVVALGIQPDIVYLVAEVMHRTPVESAGSYHFLVGCRFIKRLGV